MKKLLLVLCTAGLGVGGYVAQSRADQGTPAKAPEHECATCSGTGTCTACKNCHACGHCAKGGGTCSVCK